MSYFENKNKSMCCGCTACISICPMKDKIMVEDERGFFYPSIDRKSCTNSNCGLCEKVCPFVNSEKTLNPKAVKCYALAVNDSELRHNSSSGGAFSAVMNAFCDENTVIIGAEMCDDLKVRHTIAYSKEEAKKLRKSKYIQSDTNGIYPMTKKLLNDGIKVLFTGTGCQVGALKTFLRKDYPNLLAIDLVCHGTPNQKIFANYISYLENMHRKRIANYDFRDKTNGKLYGEKITFSNSQQTLNNPDAGLYFNAFSKDIMFMPSCYNCKFARSERPGDITIADFWGIEKFTDGFDVSKGVSLVIVNSSKGQEVFDKFENVKIYETILDNAVICNPNLVKPTIKNANYDKFMDLAIKDFPKAVKKYCGPGLKYKIAKIMPKPMKKFIKKIFGEK